MNEDFYLDGTGNSSKDVMGLGAIIAEAPTTGTLFGINRANSSWWRNQNKDSAAAYFDGTNTIFTMVNDMEELWVDCGRYVGGGAKTRWPDLILSTPTYYRLYKMGCDRLGRRFSNTTVLDAGFTNLMFNDATMIYDFDCPQDAGSGEKAFFINANFMALRYASRRNFNTTPFQKPLDQDGFAAMIQWAGELTCTNCAKQGIHQGVTAS
jgi:hypothetical protein